MKLHLPDVTLVCIDTIAHELAAMAIRECLDQVRFGGVQVYTDKPKAFHSALSSDLKDEEDDVIQLRKCEAKSLDEVARVLWYEVPKHITTSHVLVMQWDSWILNPRLWDNDWLQYDYIGAPWGWHEDGGQVGNGGFSLRSKRLMDKLQICIVDGKGGAEDILICRELRSNLENNGVKFAPIDVASRFSLEHKNFNTADEHFGFHGVWNFPYVLTPAALEQRVRLIRANPYTRDKKEVVRVFGPTPTVGPGGKTGQRGQPDQPPDPRIEAQKYVDEGMAYLNKGDFDGAKPYLLNAIEANIDCYDALLSLNYLTNPVCEDTAIALASKAIELNPHDGKHWLNLGASLWAAHRYEQAEQVQQRALKMMGDDWRVHQNLGLVYYSLGKANLAVKHLEKAVELNDNVFARNDLALATLKTGNLKLGLERYESRWNTLDKHPIWESGLELWDGKEPSRGHLRIVDTIVIHAEQGLGDTLQFVRYLPEIKRLSGNMRIILAVQPQLLRLLEHAPGADEVVNIDGSDIVRVIRAADYHCPLITAFRYLGYTYDTLPKPINHLKAPFSIDDFDFRLGGAKLSVGIVWASHPGTRSARERTLSLRSLLGLFTVPHVKFWSLQLGAASEEITKLGAEGLISNCMVGVSDMADTAAIMDKLDLVVSVCSGPLHLAAGLGRPTFMLTTFNKCWRWCNGPAAWYPTVKEFQQQAPGDWGASLAAVKMEISNLVRQKELAEAA